MSTVQSMLDRGLKWLLRLRNRHFFGLDFLVFCLTPILALALRTDGSAIAKYAQPLAFFTLAALACKLVIFFPLGLYARYWRYASVGELGLIALAGMGALVLETLVFFGILRPIGLIQPGFPRSVPLLDGLLTLLAVGGLRFSVRAADRWLHRKRSGKPARRVLIIGAGDAGSMIVKEMRTNPQLGLEPVGFVDDDPAKRKAIIHGLPVLGSRQDIPHLVKEYRIPEVIIAMPTAPGMVIREVVALGEQAGVSSKIIPGMYEIISGDVSVRQIRDVQIEDLLRREPVQTDTAAVAALLRGKRVLVTGGGGSIGSELCRQIMRCEPAELVLLGHGENSIFEIHNELEAGVRGQESVESGEGEAGDRSQGETQSAIRNPQSEIIPVIADIRHPDRLRAIFEQHRPEIVFHAAAHKHVPLMESNVEDAVTNNVLGTRCLVEASIAAGVGHFVLISTDKAVNPTSVMGATKRVAELIVQDAAGRTGRAYVAVRFGNVLGSRGSVVPYFQKQIAAGGPVTVTHPEVKRYFMTIPEAVQLVLQAAALGQGGEVFVLDMGEPVKIVDLAADLIRLSGLEVGRDIDIVYTGLRPGEKLFEELFGAGEDYVRTGHEKIFVCRNGVDPLHVQTFEPFDSAQDRRSRWNAEVDELIATARAGDAEETRRKLMEMVPGYKPEWDADER